MSARFAQTLKRLLPETVVHEMGRTKRRVARTWYRLTGCYPSFVKYGDAHQYWTERGRTFYVEDRDCRAHSSPVQLAMREEFLGELARIEFRTVLDAGCGFGRELVPLLDRFPWVRAVGVDFAETMLRDALDFCRRHGSVRLMQADLASLPFADDSFDIAFTTGVIQHDRPELLKGVLSELTRVTRRRIYHREIYRKHLAGRPDLVEIFDLSPFLFPHDYEKAYEHLRQEIVKSEVSPAYLRQAGNEMWYSLIVVELRK